MVLGCGYSYMPVLKILPFAVMQSVALVRQRQLSYLSFCFTNDQSTFGFE